MRRLSQRQKLAALLLGVLALLFVTLDVAGGSLAGAHGGAQGLFGSLYRGTDSVVGPVRRTLQGLPGSGSNREKVQQLQRENAALRAQVENDGVDARMSARLTALDARAATLGRSALPARVTALGAGQGFEWTVTLGVGSSDGVALDQTVTDGVGLVGRVVHVSKDSSVVLLAADKNAGVGVRDTRSGQLGVATGAGNLGFTVSPLDPKGDYQVGDQLLTGPVGSTTFVGDVLVGTVTAVHRTSDGNVTAVVKAATSPTALDLVAVLLPPSRATPGPPAPAAQGPR